MSDSVWLPDAPDSHSVESYPGYFFIIILAFNKRLKDYFLYLLLLLISS